MSKLIDLTGQRFGRLTVIQRAENGKDGRSRWLCQCDCGKNCVTSGKYLRKGETASCGCYGIECVTDRINKLNTTHGKTKTRLYRIWSKMKQRCTNPNVAFYHRYGGRGITVCEEWLHDFQTFWDWAMANGYRDDLSIDRIDNDKGYSPDNCRWVSQEEQNNNTSSNRKIAIGENTLTLMQWCEKQHICYTTAMGRLSRGWSIEEALELVPRKKN